MANVVRERITAPLGMTGSDMPITSEMEEPYAHGDLLGLGDEPVDVTGISASSIVGSQEAHRLFKELIVAAACN